MKKLVYIILLVVFTALVITVHLKNPQDVSLSYYFNLQWEGSLVLALTVAFIIGILLGCLLMSFSVLKNKAEVGKTKRNLKKVEREVQNLRTMPIKGEV